MIKYNVENSFTLIIAVEDEREWSLNRKILVEFVYNEGMYHMTKHYPSLSLTKAYFVTLVLPSTCFSLFYNEWLYSFYFAVYEFKYILNFEVILDQIVSKRRGSFLVEGSFQIEESVALLRFNNIVR
jgi:hypothetical protein